MAAVGSVTMVISVAGLIVGGNAIVDIAGTHTTVHGCTATINNSKKGASLWVSGSS